MIFGSSFRFGLRNIDRWDYRVEQSDSYKPNLVDYRPGVDRQLYHLLVSGC
jgi:hypothetical protein